MFKKNLLIVLLVNMLAGSVLAADPPITPFMKGNWNHVMDPHGCVELDAANELLIMIKITVAVSDLTPFPGIYYTTEFTGQGQSALKGPITNTDLVPEYLPTGELVYTFTDRVYHNSFQDDCISGNNPISFDYNITLRDQTGAPYPIANHYELLVPPFIFDPDGDGYPLLPSIEYSGNHNLCCFDSGTGNERSTTQEESTTVSNNTTVSVNTVSEAIHSEIYPSPFTEALNIKLYGLADENISLQIWDLNGKIVYSTEIIKSSGDTQKMEVLLNNLQPGFYFCNLQSQSFTHTTKILKLDH